jgi:hypothetical protein
MSMTPHEMLKELQEVMKFKPAGHCDCPFEDGKSCQLRGCLRGIVVPQKTAEPKKVPLTREDLPPVFMVRASDGIIYITNYVTQTSFRVGANDILFKKVINGLEWSPIQNEPNWKPFYKIEGSDES